MELEHTDIEDTPKPMKQRRSTMQFRSEDNNSQIKSENWQIESEDDFYATPKAFQKRPTIHCDTSLDSDVSSDKNSLDQAEWNDENEESDNKSDRQENGKHRVTGKPKTIDLVQMQKPRGANTKRAFQKEVEERCAFVAIEGEGKKERNGQ
jgi:hypothetical protein